MRIIFRQRRVGSQTRKMQQVSACEIDPRDRCHDEQPSLLPDAGPSSAARTSPASLSRAIPGEAEESPAPAGTAGYVENVLAIAPNPAPSGVEHIQELQKYGRRKSPGVRNFARIDRASRHMPQ